MFSNIVSSGIHQNTSCVKWHSAPQTQQLFIISFICWGNSTFSHGHTFFIFSLGRTWTILRILHPSFRWLAGSVMDHMCSSVVGATDVENNDSQSIHHFHYHSHLLYAGAAIFWTQSSMKSLKLYPLTFSFWFL